MTRNSKKVSLFGLSKMWLGFPKMWPGVQKMWPGFQKMWPSFMKCDSVSKNCDRVSQNLWQEGIRNSIRWPCFPKRGPGFQRKWFDFFQETGRHQKFKLTVPFKGNFFFELMPTKCLHLLSWATNHTNISKVPSSSYVGKTRQLSWCGCDEDQNN